jgi:hypothetical protein
VIVEFIVRVGQRQSRESALRVLQMEDALSQDLQKLPPARLAPARGSHPAIGMTATSAAAHGFSGQLQ